MLKNQIRIIGGEWRSRQISFYDTPGLRPTPSRIRETLFNWLQTDIPGSRCLDLYAGSGALGFEAVSRGAKVVVQVEQDNNACRALHENAAKLNASQVKIVNSDVFRFLAANNTEEAFDIVFLDPPFNLNLTTQTCQWLEEKGWLNNPSKIYLETASSNKILETMPLNWQLLKSKSAGEVSYRLYTRTT